MCILPGLDQISCLIEYLPLLFIDQLILRLEVREKAVIVIVQSPKPTTNHFQVDRLIKHYLLNKLVGDRGLERGKRGIMLIR